MARFVAIAASYCAALILFRHVSLPNWFVLTGFHLAVLLLVPYRYWPALMAGDTARLAYISATCYEQFGLLWALVNLVPSIAYYAPLVWLFRERWGLGPTRRTTNVPGLVLCALLTSLVAMGVIIGQILITPKPPGYVLHYGELIARLTLGNFLGALTIAPIALVGAQVARAAGWAHAGSLTARIGRIGRALADSRLTYDAVLMGGPLLLFLVAVGLRYEHARSLVQMAMFFVVVWLALRHGWRGAAVGGTMASIAIAVLMPDTVDHGTLQAQALLAMAITTMLLVGARIAALDGRAAQEQQDLRQALALAQRNAHMGEAHLRSTALALTQINDSVHRAFALLLGRLRHLQPAVDEAGYRRHVAGTQEQIYLLSDSLHPVALRERGLPNALREGPIARMLAEAGAVYWADTRGPVSALAPALHAALYRIVGEIIAARCATESFSDFHVRVRCGRGRAHGGRLWAVVQVDARRHPVRAHHVRFDDLNPRLRQAVSGVGPQAISDRAATFEGWVRERPIREGVRISALLINPGTPGVMAPDVSVRRATGL
ncbi:MASE1 domain-containing protein [Dyella psychrodurans]|nr:MASE1 domain-containing protein [Dyella psychrodurans]